MPTKQRIPIPKSMAARVLFLSDRTCCVCRQEGKPVQIHHIDENPSNNTLENLAVLCFDCHRESQIKGGFDRKLDADQVTLYREDWLEIVNQKRASQKSQFPPDLEDTNTSITISTSVAEIYRENREYEMLAIHYNVIGNEELRNKYIELALKENPTDSSICFLRKLQGQPDLIPIEIIDRELDRYAKHEDYTQRARLFSGIGRSKEAAIDYLKGILASLEEDNVFSAAYYIKELAEDGTLEELFVLALNKSQEANDLWWQVRALQELEWDSELKSLLLNNRNYIETSDDLELKLMLVNVAGDSEGSIFFNKEIARSQHIGNEDCIEISTTELNDKSKET